MAKIIKSIVWVGSSLKDLRAMPSVVQDDIGFALWRAQEGKKHLSTKPLKSFSGVMEIVSDHRTDAYRAVYAIKLGRNIYSFARVSKEIQAGDYHSQAGYGIDQNTVAGGQENG